MALIKCTECGKDVSDGAKSCPHCGDPHFRLTQDEKNIIQSEEEKFRTGAAIVLKTKSYIYKIIFLGVPLALLGGTLIMLKAGHKEEKTSEESPTVVSNEVETTKPIQLDLESKFTVSPKSKDGATCPYISNKLCATF